MRPEVWRLSQDPPNTPGQSTLAATAPANRLTDREHIEQRCLEEAKAALPSNDVLAAKFAHRVDEIKLEGGYPDTKIVVNGKHTYEGSWRVRFPIWAPGAGGTHEGGPMPRFIGTLVLTEVLEA